MSLRTRWRRWRLDRLEMRLADAEAYYYQWINPRKWGGTLPSTDRKWTRRIARLERKIEQAAPKQDGEASEAATGSVS